LNRDRCRALKITASINAIGDTNINRSKKEKKYNRALKINTEDLAPFLERDQVNLPFFRKPTSKPTTAAAPAPGTKPLGPEQGEKLRASRGSRRERLTFNL
jgi:hypothetical protein